MSSIARCLTVFVSVVLASCSEPLADSSPDVAEVTYGFGQIQEFFRETFKDGFSVQEDTDRVLFLVGAAGGRNFDDDVEAVRASFSDVTILNSDGDSRGIFLVFQGAMATMSITARGDYLVKLTRHR